MNSSQKHTYILKQLKQFIDGRKGVSCFDIINMFLYEIKHGKHSVTSSILILVSLWEHCVTPAQEDEVYSLLAKNLSRCRRRIHTELIDYLLLNGYNKVLRAMCWVLRGKWRYETNKVGLRVQWRILESKKIAHFFKKPRKRSVPKRMLRRYSKAA